ncbi:transcription factor atf21 [Fusarium beomiforme]|uniref:Transcription factor atf21 n=1 Tax=Fusarium beomiforme TaxID=44412 RepID=A0A9P5DZY3_9HYPO|nr:transcription factor atf21 [Fusarium beomiforme]
MGTVFPNFHHAGHPPPNDGIPAFNDFASDTYPTCTVAPDMTYINQDHTSMNPYGTLAQVPWEQWWSADRAVFPKSSEMAGSNVYSPEEPRFNNNNNNNNCTYEPEYSTQWASPATSMQVYPIPSPATESTCPETSTCSSESRRGSSSTQSDKRKRKRKINQPAATKSTRRGFTEKKEIKTEDSDRKSKARTKAQPASKPMITPSPQEGEGMNDYNRQVQERNRIASNKFRVKKREHEKKLREDEEDMERANRDLSSCVSDLTLQVRQLKMRLLQHTDCDCHLIQDYISNEAHRYIQDLGDSKQPPHPPIEQPRC